MDRNTNNNHNIRGGGGGGDGLLLRSAAAAAATSINNTVTTTTTSSSDFVLQWGNRKRLRCMKFQVKDRDNHHHHPNSSTVRVDRRSDRIKDSSQLNYNNNNGSNVVSNNNGHLNHRQPSVSPSHRVLRNSDSSLVAMRGQSNGIRGLASPDRGGGGDKKGNNHNHSNGIKNNSNNNNNNGSHDYNNNNNNVNGSASSDSKKGGGTSSGTGSDAIPTVWPPKFVIALTTKEKEEDFMAIKGSKLPQRPKKRAKFIQRTLNLVSPGSWLCDLTLERYEVREKKVSKKIVASRPLQRPRGLRAMGNMDSDSE